METYLTDKHKTRILSQYLINENVKKIINAMIIDDNNYLDKNIWKMKCNSLFFTDCNKYYESICKNKYFIFYEKNDNRLPFTSDTRNLILVILINVN
jgi:hypothetical protein